MNLTPEQEATIKKNLSDQYWRMNHLYWIQDANGNKVRFKMNAVQDDFYWKQWYLNVIAKARQFGFSTLIDILILDTLLFNRNTTGGIIDRTDEDGQKKLGKMRFAYEHLADDDPDDPEGAAYGQIVKSAVGVVRWNEHEARFTNDSQAWTATSLRGGTTQILHISEYGPIAYDNPIKAQEIKTGAFNTVHSGSKIFIESTHKGGRYGLFYEMIKLAQKCPKTPTAMDWKLYFYGWYKHPEYKLGFTDDNNWTPNAEAQTYFDELLKRDIRLSKKQKHWWTKKREAMMNPEDMAREFPGTLDEMLNSVISGSVYGTLIARLRNEHRIVDYAPDPASPLYTFWDLGQTDLVCIWLAQFVGPNIQIVDYYSSCREYPRAYVDVVHAWETKYKIAVRLNVLPHDGEVQNGVGPSWRREFEACGMRNIACVPKTPDKWIGINQVRRILPMCIFNATQCTKQFEKVDNQNVPNGLEALECYRVEVQDDGSGRGMKEQPVHDEFSHGADAFRTLAEAMSHGMLKGGSAVEKSFRNRVSEVEDDDEHDERKSRVIANIHGGRSRCSVKHAMSARY